MSMLPLKHPSGSLSTCPLLSSPTWLVAPALDRGWLREKAKMSQERQGSSGRLGESLTLEFQGTFLWEVVSSCPDLGCRHEPC